MFLGQQHLQCIVMSSVNSFASQEPSRNINIVLRQRCNLSVILLLVQYIIYVSALIMTLIALGLLVRVQNLAKYTVPGGGVGPNICLLYMRRVTYMYTGISIDYGNRPSCIVSLLFASIATVYLIILAVLGLVKLTLNVK